MDPDAARSLREKIARADNITPEFESPEEAIDYIWRHYFIRIRTYSSFVESENRVNFSLTELQAIAKTLGIMAAELGDPEGGGAETLRRLIGTDRFDLTLERGSPKTYFGSLRGVGGKGLTGTLQIMEFDDNPEPWLNKFFASESAKNTETTPLIIRLYTRAFVPGMLEFTLAHELGHVVDLRSPGKILRQEYYSQYKDQPILVENNSAAEMVADAFASWFFNPATYVVRNYEDSSYYRSGGIGLDWVQKRVIEPAYVFGPPAP
jgi:hypothetical protein